VDIISHTLCGALLGGVDTGSRLGPGARLAATLGALAPDGDLVVALSGWDRYLHYHEAGTHSVFASPLVAAAVALCLRRTVHRSRFAPLFLAALAGVLLGHLGLDLISGADIRLFAPIWNVRLAPHLFAMGDVLVIGIMGGGFLLGLRHPKAGAVCAAAALALLILGKQQSQGKATADFGRPSGVDPARQSAGHADAINGSLFSWTIYERDGEVLRVWNVDARTGNRSIRFERRTDPSVSQQAAAVPAIRDFIALLHLPVVRIEVIGDRRFVLWSDLRDCSATNCAVSVGAEIDSAGRLVRQVIRVGPLNQERAIPAIRAAPYSAAALFGDRRRAWIRAFAKTDP
jgi:membrane-bound metal-dependent hydrolase YbcI (DUF457 family)